MSPKIITVYGATGRQGGSLVRSLLENKSGDFAIRGITRNPDSDSAKALAARGVEVVKGDGMVKQDMLNAFKGSWAVFLNTNSDDPALYQPDGPSESDHGKEVVDAAFESGVQVLLYSGTCSPNKITSGKIISVGMDEKYAIVEYIKTKGFKSAINVGTGWYIENHVNPEVAGILGGLPYNVDEEGYLTLNMPKCGNKVEREIPLACIGDDYGDIVHGVLLNPEAYHGQNVQCFSSLSTPTQIAAAVEKATGKKSRYVPMEDWNTMETYGSAEIETVKNLFGFLEYTDAQYFGVASDLAASVELKKAAAVAKGGSEADGKLTSLDDFMVKFFAKEGKNKE